MAYGLISLLTFTIYSLLAEALFPDIWQVSPRASSLGVPRGTGLGKGRERVGQRTLRELARWLLAGVRRRDLCLPGKKRNFLR